MCLPTTWDMESFVPFLPRCTAPSLEGAQSHDILGDREIMGNRNKSRVSTYVHLCPPMSTYVHLSRHRARFPGALQHFYAFAGMCMHFYAVIPILSEWDLDGFSGTMSDS